MEMIYGGGGFGLQYEWVGCWWAREARIEYIIYGSTITILATRRKRLRHIHISLHRRIFI